VANLSDKERRALTWLAHYPDGCDETELLVGGVTVGHLATLVMDGFATMRATLRAGAAGREKSVVWMKITAAGLEAAAE
jgi:hypothetical protein